MAKTNSTRARKQPSKLLKNRSKVKHPQILIFVLFIVIFALIGSCLFMFSRASGTAIMSVLPANQTAQVGNTISVTIQEDSLSDAINAVEADLTYDQTKLRFVSIAMMAPFDTLVTQKTGGNGIVRIAAATANTTVSGSHTLATIVFNVIASGSVSINLSNTSAIIRQSDTSNVLGIMNGSTITSGVTADTSAPSVPANLVLVLSTRTSITFNWSSSSDNTAVAGYNIYRNGALVGKSNTNKYTDTGLTFKKYYTYTVSAYDNAGNVSAQSAASTYKATGKR